MNILIDTHIFLWYINDYTKLSKKYIDLIINEKNDIFLSSASIWECCIKQQIGKMIFPKNAAIYLSEKRNLHNIKTLVINELCLKHLSTLPVIHKDPFDRILICQAIDNQMKLITDDEKICQYKIKGLSII
ncbi:MAG: hypothetical protein A2033_08825 [Bacteroidetes bacterium GWA2_31_9]|nr:MAG: hypothetical protein A2033_08825 [Bacteroidetes bacterium GWA2_31_9]